MSIADNSGINRLTAKGYTFWSRVKDREDQVNLSDAPALKIIEVCPSEALQ